MTDIQVGDIGTVFEVTLKDNGVIVDISGATEKLFYFQKINANKTTTTVTKTPSFVTDGTDGKLQYTTILDDIDIKGIWKLQAKVTLPTWSGRSAVGTFTVKPNLT